MPELSELSARAASLLSRPVTAAPVARLAAAGTKKRRFTPFATEDADDAVALAGEFMATAQSAPGNDGLKAALDRFEQMLTAVDPELAKHAFLIFLTHDEKGRQIPISPLEKREPKTVLPSIPPAAMAAMAGLLGATGNEARMNWFREDPLANEHHEHWHVVYPMRGVPDANGRRKAKDRQGELFFYMHEQMLARYDADRLAVGLPAVKPFDKYTEPIPEGFDPEPGIAGFTGRPDDQKLSDLTGDDPYTLATHEELRKRILQAAETGLFHSGDTVDIDSLGATEEPTVGTVEGAYYGNHHGFGHVLAAYCMDPTEQGVPGVMALPKTAIRDPFFFRWHKHVDNMGFAWQQTQDPETFTDLPNVTIRKQGSAEGTGSPDVILCFADQIPDGNFEDFGNKNFGGPHWDDEFYSKVPATGTLETSMQNRDIDVDGTPTPISYVDHRDFAYFLRVSSPSLTDLRVTVRIFLAPEVSMRLDRRAWIEMDKFVQVLKPGKNVIARPGKLSSVVRKPAVRPGEKPADCPGEEKNYCQCGWPYTMLLPRGTSDGMDFKLLVMLTDWNKDRVGGDTCCGSMSFCGAADVYPDQRPMGYPFHRRFLASIPDTFNDAALKAVAMRGLKIKLTS